MDGSTAEALETLAAATVEARVFLGRVKPRKFKTLGADGKPTGKEATTEELARGLVKRAELEHAVVPGRRPKSILCADCKRMVPVADAGSIPKRCVRCRKDRQMHQARLAARRHVDAGLVEESAQAVCTCDRRTGRAGPHRLACARRKLAKK